MTEEIKQNDTPPESESAAPADTAAPETDDTPAEVQEESAAEPAEEAVAAPVSDATVSEPDAGDDFDDDDDEEFIGHAEPLELIEEEDEAEVDHQWYILKVASNREGTISDALRRRVKVEGLEKYFDQILVPTEDVAEFKNGKKKVVKKKLYPGYICVHMSLNEDTWFLVRETPGIGDFTGAAGKPTPMSPEDIKRVLPPDPTEDGEEEGVKTAIPFEVGERVRIKEGTFQSFEGDIESIDEGNGRVSVVINIFDRATPVEIDYFPLGKGLTETN